MDEGAGIERGSMINRMVLRGLYEVLKYEINRKLSGKG